MRREATAAALSLSLLLLVPGVEAQRRAPRDDVPPPRPDRIRPIPPEDPSVVDDPAGISAWSAGPRGPGAAPYAVPRRVISAYERAVAASPPGCHLTVSLLAAIGQVESGNLAGRRLDAANRVRPAILGPVLDGDGTRAIADTDAGRWDGNRRWDRALGPLQFIPTSWREVGVDLDGDGIRDPQDLDDAAGAAMVYLCAGGRDLATEAGLRAAILSYNHSTAYLRLVLAWKAAFDSVDLTGWGVAPLYTAWQVPLTEPVTVAASTTVPRPRHPVPVHDGAVMSAVGAPLVSAPAPPVVATGSPDPVPAASPADPTPADPVPTEPCPAPSPVPSPTPSPAPSPVVPGPTDPAVPAAATEPVPTQDPTPDPTSDPTPADQPATPCTPAPVPVPSPEPTPGTDPALEPVAPPVS